MRRMVGCAVFFVFASCVCLAQQRVSINVVGFNRIEVPAGGRTLSAPAFSDIDDSSNTLESVFGISQMSSALNPNDCDRVFLWDAASQQYAIYAVFPGYTNLPTYDMPAGWRDATTSEVWGNPAIANTNPPVPPGVAYWIVRGGGKPDTQLTITGQVIDLASNAVDIVEDLQFVSYGFSAPIKLVDTTCVEDGATSSLNPGDADNIKVWTTNQQYEIFGYFPGYTNGGTQIPAGWRLCTTTDDWNDPNKGLTDYELQVGEGAWYVSQSDFTWTETNKYPDVLEQ